MNLIMIYGMVDEIEKLANGDMLQYYIDNPDKLKEKQKRDARKEKRAYEIKPSDRPSIPKKDFAQPKKEEAGHKGKYPIPDRQHARSALGFAKMHGDTAAYAAVRAKIKHKFPDMLDKEATSGSKVLNAIKKSPKMIKYTEGGYC